MARFGLTIKSLRAEKNIPSQAALGERSSVHRNTINRIERTAMTPDDVDEKTLKLLALGLGMPVENLIEVWRLQEQASVKPPNGHGGQIPVLASIPASFDCDGDVAEAYDFEEAIDYLPGTFRDAADPRMFGLVVEGDSMAPRYPAGCYISCSPRHWHDHGFADGHCYAIRLASGETTVKRVHLLDDGARLELVPENPLHPTRRVSADEVGVAALVRGSYTKEPLPG